MRNNNIDAVKAFAIVCVVLGHCIQYGCGSAYLNSEAFYDNALFKFIYSFHMPLFMLVSGYLFGYSVTKGRWFNAAWKRWKSLIPPILVWTIIPFCQYHNLSEDPLSVTGIIGEYLYTSIHTLWFLWAVLLCVTVVCLNRRFFKDSIIVYIIGFCLTFASPDWFQFATYKYVYPFFIIGYLYNRYGNTFVAKMAEKKYTFVILLVIYVVLMFFFDKEKYIYTTGYSILCDNGLSIHQFMIDLYRFVLGLAGSCIVILAINMLYPRFHKVKGRKAVELLGANTLGIYILSGHMVSPVLAQIVTCANGFNIFLVLLETITIVILCISLTLILKRTRVIKRLLIGN